jgi:hypothetical protein
MAFKKSVEASRGGVFALDTIGNISAQSGIRGAKLEHCLRPSDMARILLIER